MTSPQPSIDYRSLIRDRKAKQTRATVRYVLCLAPELFADLEDLQTEVRAEAYTDVDEDDQDKPKDTRMGGKPPADPATPAGLLTELEARIEAASVVAVFKAPTAARQAELNRMYDSDDPISHTITSILDAFVCFEAHGEPIPADRLGRDDLADLLPVMAQGELIGLGNLVVEASAGAPDLPFSVRRSLLNRPSAGTSRRR